MTEIGADLTSLQDYICGRLSEAERIAFEERLASDAELVRELELSLRLREGLELLREQQDPVVRSVTRRRWGAIGWLGATAAAVVMVVLGATVAHYLGSAGALVAASVEKLGASGGGARLAVVEHYSFATLRDAAAMPVLTVPTSGAVELRALTPPLAGGHTAFRVTLEEMRGSRGSRIGGVEHVVPDLDGFVPVYVDAARLRPGAYALSVAPEADGADAGERFLFEVRHAGGSAP